ncbi:MAG: DNA-3-methyladenine glycosylase [Panacibacter sp.]
MPQNKIDKQILCNDSLKLDESFYSHTDVLFIAKELIGKILVTRFSKTLAAARIVETEAYNGVVDKASHAYNGRRTNRTEIMYRSGGAAYVYLCYGIHHLFNVVTNARDIPHAVLIRAAEPVYGIETMLLRTRKTVFDYTLTKGPGNVSKALGITSRNTGSNLLGKEIYIINDGIKYEPGILIASPRIGVDYAAEDALLPYRFYLKDNRFVSRKNK